MRVSSFKVSNYRSIESAEVELSDLTCLVGANNEGKSNLLRAFNLGFMAVLGTDRGFRRTRSRFREDSLYFDPQFDRPVGKDNRAITTITIRFALSDQECLDFQDTIGHGLNGDLPVQVQLLASGRSSVQYKKQRIGSELTGRHEEISEFIGERLSFQYVPPIRTAADAAQVIETLIQSRLRSLGADEDFVAAQELIRTKVRDAMESVESDLQDVLPRFLPNVQGVHLEVDATAPLAQNSVLRSIQIDDGATTELIAKGSGVQSLAAMALLRHRVQNRHGERRYVLAMEEPEAHLHSGALHQLRPLLAEIATEQQLIFATHSGVLVPTSAQASTVIVRDNRARTSTSLTEVREALGVRLSDNLASARLVLLCEGSSDIAFLDFALREFSPDLSAALDDEEIAFEDTGGSNNLPYQLQNIRRAACDCFVVFDGDSDGTRAIENATESGELADDEYLLVRWSGQEVAELEDLLDSDWVQAAFDDHFGGPVPIGTDRGKKWSDRARVALTAAGKSSTKSTINRAKDFIWERFEDEAHADIISRHGAEFATRLGALLQGRVGGD